MSAVAAPLSLNRRLSAPRRLALLVAVAFSALYGQGSGPAGYWTFDTATISGTQVQDSSGNAYNGTLSNASSITGRTNQALSFSGTGSYVSVPDNAVFQLTHDLSISVWVKSTNSTQLQNFVGKYNDTGAESGYLLQLSSAGVLTVQIGGNNLASGTKSVADTTHINDGNWHHIAVVIPMGQNVKIYVDGTLSSTTNQVPTSSGDGSTVYLGTSPNEYYGSPFTGSLDEVRIYNRALTVSDVSSLASGAVSAPSIVPGTGIYTGAQSVSLSSTTAGATIRYTTDGSTPTESHGAVYSGSPVSIAANATLKAIAYVAGSSDSAVTSAAYTIVSANPRRIGVKSTGAYWGADGEHIDLLSGNLSFAVPVLGAKARGGWGATFALSYNSQIWQQVSGTTNRIGGDVGYGFGWTLQAGALLPLGNAYLFSDATGAQYRLDQYASGLWTSREGAHVTFDQNASKLYFPDGSFWIMNVQSAISEDDAGTLHPSLIQDSNGNRIQLQYAAAKGYTTANTSARITNIMDTRASGGSASYTFNYNTDSTPHLTSITNSLGSPETYGFAYTSQTLQSPFSPPQSFGTATLLQSVTLSNLSLSHSFQYSSGGSGELTQVTKPLGGVLGWSYRTYAYTGTGLTYREVQSRTMTAIPGGAQLTWNISPDSGTTIHASTTVSDVGAGTSRVWTFRTDAGVFQGVAATYEERDSAGTLLHKDYTWSQDGGGNVFTSSVVATLNPGSAYATQARTDYAQDSYGNTTQTSNYDFGNTNSPARVYNYGFLGGTAASMYIRNRRTSASVTAGGQNTTLETRQYDDPNMTLTDRPGITAHDSTYGTSFLTRGNVTQILTPDAVRNVKYDIGGMLTSVDDGNSHSVSLQPASGTNFSAPGTVLPNGLADLQSTFTYSAALLPASATGPNSDSTTNTYDSFGRVATSVSPTGAMTSYNYNYAQRQITATISGAGIQTRWQRATVDGFGRTIKVETGDGATTRSTVDITYGAASCAPLGKVVSASQPYAPGDTEVYKRYTYDGSGRTLTITAPDGASVTRYSYQGNQTTVTDPAGKWKKYTRDAFGNLAAVNEPNPQGGADYVTSYNYDALNHLTQVTMTRGGTTQTRSFSYDATTHRLTRTVTPESGTVQYAYNADGTLLSKVDQKGQKIQYQYDSYARPSYIYFYAVGATLPDPCQTVRISYDQQEIPGSTSYPKGRRTGIHWGEASGCPYKFEELYSYTQPGFVQTKRVTATKAGTSTVNLDGNFTYDSEGRVLSYQPPPQDSSTAASTALYSYYRDTLGRATGLSNQGNVVVYTATYGAANQLLSMYYPQDGYTETRQYNANLQLTRLTATPQSGTGIDIEYDYASPTNGRVSQTKDWITGSQVTYTYDSLSRLTQAITTDPPQGQNWGVQWGLSFAYDGFGNLLQQTPVKGTPPSMSLGVDATTNRINSTGYQYDADGNLTTLPGGTTYTYDVANRIVSNGGSLSASYNPSNQRIWDGTYLYYYGVGGELLGRYQPTFGSTSTWARDGGATIWFGGKLIRYRGQWVMTDRLGSVRANEGGERFDFYPYGGEITATADGRPKFGTYFRDSAGQDYAINRYYGSGMGRFLSPDPAVSRVSPARPQSWNRYAYGEADPANLNDPLGENVFSAIGNFFSGIGSDIAAGASYLGNAIGDFFGGGGPAAITSSIYYAGGDGPQNTTTAYYPATGIMAVDQAVGDFANKYINPIANSPVVNGVNAVGAAVLPFVGGAEAIAGEAVESAVGAADAAADAAGAASTGRVFYGTPEGALIPAPEGYTAVAAQNGRGLVLLPGGQALGDNANIIRYGDQGYIRYYNDFGQPLNPMTGLPGTNALTHFSPDYIGPLLNYPGGN